MTTLTTKQYMNNQQLNGMDLFTDPQTQCNDLLGAIKAFMQGSMEYRGYEWEQDGDNYKLFLNDNPFLLGTAKELNSDCVKFTLQRRCGYFTDNMELLLGDVWEDTENKEEWNLTDCRDRGTDIDLTEAIAWLNSIDNNHKYYTF